MGTAPGVIERVDWARPPELPSVVVLRVEQCARLWRVYHDTYTVSYCTKSAADWTYRSKSYVASPGGVSLMQPGEVHNTIRMFAGRASCRVLFIDPAVMIRAALELGMAATRLHFKFAQIDGHRLSKALAGLHGSLERPATELERQSRFTACLTHLLNVCEERPAALESRADQPAVAKACEFLHEHLAERVTLDDLTAAAGAIDRFHLIHAFTAQLGIPPHAYQIRMRVARARRLLETGTPPAEAAAALGFADQSHFTRRFHETMGTTPAKYAKATS